MTIQERGGMRSDDIQTLMHGIIADVYRESKFGEAPRTIGGILLARVTAKGTTDAITPEALSGLAGMTLDEANLQIDTLVAHGLALRVEQGTLPKVVAFVGWEAEELPALEL